MKNFKEMISEITANAMAEIEVNETINLVNEEQNALEKALARLESMDTDVLARAKEDANAVDGHTRYYDVMSGYDSQYMNRNDWRVARKIRNNSAYNIRKENYEAEQKAKFEYDLVQAGVKKATIAKIKKHKSLPNATYVKIDKKVYTKDYKPSNSSFETVRVVDYRIYHKAIVLEVASADAERITGYFDDMINEYNAKRDVYFDVDTRNESTYHVVFRYEPFDRFGKPNKYDGIMQLRNFLNQQKFITEQKPVRVGEYLEILKGNKVNLPLSMVYNYTEKSDKLTVYKVYGNFEEFDKELRAE